jgi:SsrA-binding protein
MSLVDNKKAGFNYEITDKYEAGIELLGHETKSVRQNRGSLDGAHVKIRGKEAFLVGATIPPYQTGNTPKNYDPERTRRLLLTKQELKYLTGLEKEKGITLIPLAFFPKGRFIKLSFGVGKHKKKFDKRETIKKRETNREIEREMKRGVR